MAVQNAKEIFRKYGSVSQYYMVKVSGI